jgi:hypothetical protein
MSAALQRLRAEIRFDRDAFVERVHELGGVTLGTAATAADAAQAAVALHHAYCAVESILVRVARQLEGAIPEGADWHQALLHAAGLDIDGVRPALLSRQSVESLRRLLGFRHFFRHGYAVPLDPAQLDLLRHEALGLAPRLLQEIDQLDAFLGEVAANSSD